MHQDAEERMFFLGHISAYGISPHGLRRGKGSGIINKKSGREDVP